MKHYVRFKTLNKFFGKTYFPNRIVIDLCDGTNPIKTYLHELIHMNNPDWTCQRVRKLEKKTWNKMSTREKFELGKKLFNRKWRRPW